MTHSFCWIKSLNQVDWAYVQFGTLRRSEVCHDVLIRGRICVNLTSTVEVFSYYLFYMHTLSGEQDVSIDQFNLLLLESHPYVFWSHTKSYLMCVWLLIITFKLTCILYWPTHLHAGAMSWMHNEAWRIQCIVTISASSFSRLFGTITLGIMHGSFVRFFTPLSWV